MTGNINKRLRGISLFMYFIGVLIGLVLPDIDPIFGILTLMTGLVGFLIFSLLDGEITALRIIRTISAFLLIGGTLLNFDVGFDTLGLFFQVGLVGLLTTSVVDLKNDETIFVKLNKIIRDISVLLIICFIILVK